MDIRGSPRSADEMSLVLDILNEQMFQRRDKTWGHTILVGNDAQISFDGLSSQGGYDVYRPDGMYAKKVGSFATLWGAEQFVKANGWDLVK
jgi:hypothetical protein